MSTDDSGGFTDEVKTELYQDRPDDPEFPADPGPQPVPIPDRPADGASVEKWVSYLVALGADRTYLTEMTAHQDGPNDCEMVPPLKRADLIELADRLGG